MLIDGGNVDDGQLVVSYLEQQGVEELKAVICTHAHEDHVGGLPAVLAVYPTRAVYSPTTTYASKCFDDFMRYVDQQRLTVTLPVPGDGFDLGDARVTILGPVKDYPDTNNTSIVTRVDYGETSFLFTGDMEQEAENDLIDAGANLRCDVLKVGHHGSNTSSGYRFLYEVEPTYGVISVGTGQWRTIWFVDEPMNTRPKCPSVDEPTMSRSPFFHFSAPSASSQPWPLPTSASTWRSG